mgnify:CR=1 FL=1
MHAMCDVYHIKCKYHEKMDKPSWACSMSQCGAARALLASKELSCAAAVLQSFLTRVDNVQMQCAHFNYH